MPLSPADPLVIRLIEIGTHFAMLYQFQYGQDNLYDEWDNIASQLTKIIMEEGGSAPEPIPE